MSAQDDLTAEKARRLWDYDPTTGRLTWKARPLSDFKRERDWKTWNSKNAGKEAGGINPTDGYRVVRYAGRLYKVHRLIWLVVHGRWPTEIDHRSGIRTQNDLTNLREVTHQENHRNRARQSNNTSGTNGVHMHRRRGKYQAYIETNGKRRFLGYYDDIEDAIAARIFAEVEEGFHENHGRERHPDTPPSRYRARK